MKFPNKQLDIESPVLNLEAMVSKFNIVTVRLGCLRNAGLRNCCYVSAGSSTASTVQARSRDVITLTYLTFATSNKPSTLLNTPPVFLHNSRHSSCNRVQSTRTWTTVPCAPHRHKQVVNFTFTYR